MTNVKPIRDIENPIHRRFVASALLRLKERLKSDILAGAEAETQSLRLASWNLMHFGNGGAYTREAESMMYIAEIIDHFDLVAIQEVNENLAALETLFRDHLGSGWDYIVTDTTEGSKGNSERLAFAFRKSKVWFRREAGEIVLPTGQKIVEPGRASDAGDAAAGRDDDDADGVQFARTPFSVAFQSGWFKFKLCTVHIFYGNASETSPEMAHRREEIRRIADFLAARQSKEQKVQGKAANFVLLGDFNIVSPEHHTMQALEGAGFVIPEAIKNAPTSLSGKHHYDQIAFRLADDRFSLLRSGVFSMFDVIYRNEDSDHYLDHVWGTAFDRNSDGNLRTRDQKENYYRRYYRKHQMSDHKLLWCEIQTDFSKDYLNAVLADG